MLSRIFWVGIAGFAIVVGMVVQDGGRIFSWAADHPDISAKVEQTVAASVDRAVEGSIDEMTIMGSDGDEIDVPPQTKRALAEAVGRLVKAKANEAMLRARDASAEELQAAEARSEQARADVDRLKAEIKRLDKSALVDSETVTRQVRDQVRQDIRAEIREAVGN